MNDRTRVVLLYYFSSGLALALAFSHARKPFGYGALVMAVILIATGTDYATVRNFGVADFMEDVEKGLAAGWHSFKQLTLKDAGPAVADVVLRQKPFRGIRTPVKKLMEGMGRDTAQVVEDIPAITQSTLVGGVTGGGKTTLVMAMIYQAIEGAPKGMQPQLIVGDPNYGKRAKKGEYIWGSLPVWPKDFDISPDQAKFLPDVVEGKIYTKYGHIWEILKLDAEEMEFRIEQTVQSPGKPFPLRITILDEWPSQWEALDDLSEIEEDPKQAIWSKLPKNAGQRAIKNISKKAREGQGYGMISVLITQNLAVNYTGLKESAQSQCAIILCIGKKDTPRFKIQDDLNVIDRDGRLMRTAQEYWKSHPEDRLAFFYRDGIPVVLKIPYTKDRQIQLQDFDEDAEIQKWIAGIEFWDEVDAEHIAGNSPSITNYWQEALRMWPVSDKKFERQSNGNPWYEAFRDRFKKEAK